MNQKTTRPSRKKVKVCPNCSKEHTKRGPYCDIHCFAKHRDQDAINAKVSDTLKGSETAYNLNRDEDKEPLLAGGLTGRSNSEFIADGDIWTSSDW